MRMEVRCCCNAGKLLGYMDVPEGTRGEFFAGPNNLKLEVGRIVTPFDCMLEVAMGVEGLLGHRAVKSNDYPIEELKKIPSFEEA